VPVQQLPLQQPGAGQSFVGPSGTFAVPHCPPLQVAALQIAPGQTSPHPLQLFGSVRVLTHWPLQQVKPSPHVVPVFPHSQAPPTQCSPDGQVIGVPAQVPFPSQTSFEVQGSPSLQGVFFAFGV
jgi:hypothetical protein